MRLNVAGYFIQATDVQFTLSVSTGSGAVTSVATNQGEGEIIGAEVELQAAITEAMTITAGYSYTDTEITKGCDADEYSLNTGGIIYSPSLGTVPECDISGRRYPLGPEQAGSLALNYDAPLEWGQGLSLISNFSVTYEGSKYKMPVLNLRANGQFQWEYLENRKLYGVSANTSLGNWAVGWELSYRPKEAVSLSTCYAPGTDTSWANALVGVDCPMWIDKPKYQMHLTGILSLTPGDHGWLLNLLGADSRRRSSARRCGSISTESARTSSTCGKPTGPR